MKTEKQKQYLLAAIELAKRSSNTKFLASLQSSFEETKKIMARSERQQRASLRLLQLGGAFSR